MLGIKDLGDFLGKRPGEAMGCAYAHVEADGELDLRFDTSEGEPASALVNRLKETALADLIFQLGEERFSRRIARRISSA